MSNWIKPKQRMCFVCCCCDGLTSNGSPFFNFFTSAIRLRLMNTGTSDTWWPDSFLASDLNVKTGGESVKVISQRRKQLQQRKTHTNRTLSGSPLASSKGHLTHSYDDLSRQEVPSLQRFMWQRTCQDS